MKCILNNSKKKIISITTMLILGILFYGCAGQKWISIEDDSAAFMNSGNHEGVMPIYPLFLSALKAWLGEGAYLNGVVIIQSILAIFCTLLFVCYLQKQFQLAWWEEIILYIICMLPFSIYLPESGITHQIMTEGIAYAFFYIYFLFLLKYVFTGKIKWCVSTWGMAVVMSLIRSQLLFLLLVLATVFILITVIHSKKQKTWRKIVVFVSSIACSGVIVFLSVLAIYRIAPELSIDKLSRYGVEEKQLEEKTELTKDETEIAPSAHSLYLQNMSQFTSVIMIRGLYEADATDEQLFENEEEKELFNYVYKAIDEKKYRYTYARQDLYMWKDLICDKIPIAAFQGYNEYIIDNPHSDIEPRSVLTKISLKILINHFGRYLYHTMRMMISGFISSIFFQISKIYLLCHFITLALFLLAVIGAVWCEKRGKNKQVAEFMATTLVFIGLMVTIVNVMFFGLQRYMVYAMGLFYCSSYLLLKELVFEPFIEKYKARRDIRN